ncbi:MAG TPA: ATP-binding protein [Thermoanaerobaculia bacterium]|nr:ATP-binding protein [Thermoanaerobaculia bacterium]
MRRGAWSIRAWLGSLVAAVALPMLAVLAWMFLWQLEREKEEARDKARRIAITTAAAIRAQHESSETLLARIAQRSAVRSFDGAACDPIFATVSSFPHWADLLFFDRSGAVVCSATPQGENVRPLIARERSGLVPRRPVVRFAGGRWVSIVAEPVPEVGGTLVLVQRLDFDIGDALVANAVTTVLDRDGRVIARSAGGPAILGIDAARSEAGGIALREHEGFAEATGVDGVHRQYGFTFLPELGWTIFSGVPTEDVMREVRMLVIIGAGGGVVIIFFIAIAATMLSRRIEKPVSALVEAAESAARGGSGRVQADGGPREIALLSAAFNEMIEHRSISERDLKALSERLLLVQEQERMRVARELHDDLGQSLTALKMDVIGFIEKSRHAPDAAPLVERILRTIDSTVTAVQRISSELRPSALDDLGLFAALESEARLFEERTGIECDLSLPDDLPGIDEAATVPVYRMIQEAMTNVARHSNASRVEIRVRRRASELLLEIRDDGRGIASGEAASPSALGLAGIRERAAMLGGAVLIEGVPDRGTIVSVRIPLPLQENEA